MGRLTEQQIKAWIKDKTPLSRADGDGLTFTLSPGGTASWVLRYRMPGRKNQSEKTYGNYPEIPLKKARELAFEDRKKIQLGIDVAREKQTNKRKAASAWTVKALATDYEETILPTLAASTGVARRQKIRDYINPVIGHLSAQEVTGGDIVHLLEKAKAKSPKLVKGVLSVVKLIFSYGYTKHIVSENPAERISPKSIAGANGNARRRRLQLKPEELEVLLPALGKRNKVIGLIIRILLETGVRISALMLAEWTHVDLKKKVWRVPPEEGRKVTRKSANGDSSDFIIPLTDQVVGFFEQLKKFAGNSRYVCPVMKRRKAGDYPMPPGSINHAIEKICSDLGGKVRRFTPHDLRSTFRSYLLERLGSSLVVAERCLNHSLGGLIETYDQSDYLDERRSLHEKWSLFLAQLERVKDLAVPVQGSSSNS